MRDEILAEMERKPKEPDKIQELIIEAYTYFGDYSIYRVLDKDRGEATRIMKRLYLGADPLKIDKYLDVLDRLKLEIRYNPASLN